MKNPFESLIATCTGFAPATRVRELKDVDVDVDVYVLARWRFEAWMGL